MAEDPSSGSSAMTFGLGGSMALVAVEQSLNQTTTPSQTGIPEAHDSQHLSFGPNLSHEGARQIATMFVQQVCPSPHRPLAKFQHLLEGQLLDRLNTVQLHPKDADRGAETTVRGLSAKRLDTVPLVTHDSRDPSHLGQGEPLSHPDDPEDWMLPFAKGGHLTRRQLPFPESPGRERRHPPPSKE